MKQEIIDWYSERNYQPRKVIGVLNRLGISRPQIKAAMVHCYYKIEAGKFVAPENIIRYVINVARTIKVGQDDEIAANNLKARIVISNLEDEIVTMKATLMGTWAVGGLINVLIWLYYFTKGWV